MRVHSSAQTDFVQGGEYNFIIDVISSQIIFKQLNKVKDIKYVLENYRKKNKTFPKQLNNSLEKKESPTLYFKIKKYTLTRIIYDLKD